MGRERAQPQRGNAGSRHRPPRSERGTALILAPLAVVVIVFLGAIAVDSGALFLTRRSLADAALGAANDAVAAGFDAEVFATTGRVEIDPVRAHRAASASLAAHRGQLPDGAELVLVVTGSAPGGPTVHVTISAVARGVFFPTSTRLHASASARPAVGR